MALTLASSAGKLAPFDSSTTVRCYRFKTLSSANKVVRTGKSLEVRYSSTHKAHVGALVMLACSERKFCAFGEITSLLDTTKFTVDALYGSSTGADNGNNTQPVQVVFMSESSCASWLQRALDDERISGAYRVAALPSRGSRNGADVVVEMPDIRASFLTSPMVVIGSLSSNNDLLDTAVNPATVENAFDANMRQLLNDGHEVVITNIRPVDRNYATPTTAQEQALLRVNQHYLRLAQDYPDVSVVDWYSRFVNPSDVNGGARPNLYVDQVHFNTDGATEAGKDMADMLERKMRSSRVSRLRQGLWDGPARGSVIGANICGALLDSSSYTPGDTGASGNLSTHVVMSGSGAGRTSVCSLIQLPDGSYKQRVLMTGGSNQYTYLRIEGPSGSKMAASLVAGAYYDVAMGYAFTNLVNVASIEVIADGSITYPTLGVYVGNFGAGMSHEGEGPADVPASYYPTLNRMGEMIFPAPIKIPSSALSINDFGIWIKVKFSASGGTALIEFDRPTVRRIA